MIEVGGCFVGREKFRLRAAAGFRRCGPRADTRRAGLAGWLRVTAAAISFPAAWSALSRRSLGDRGTPSPRNQSTSQTHSAPVDVQEIEDRGRDLVVLSIAPA